MQNTKEQQGERKKLSQVNNAKKQRKKMECERLEIPQENWRYQGKISCKEGHNKGQKQQGSNRSRRDSEEVARIHRTV